MSQFRNTELSSAKQINHVGSSIQSSYSVCRIVVTVMECTTVYLERALQTVSRAASPVNPTLERTEVSHLLWSIFHNQDTCNSTCSLSVERVHIDTVFCRLTIDFVCDGIPQHSLFCLVQLTSLAKYVFHQEV